MRRTAVHRFTVGLVGTLFLVAIALLYAAAELFVLAVVPLGYVAYGALSADPDPTLSVERSVSTGAPTPGSAVTVTLTVTNAGEATLPDVRVVDGVPEDLVVVAGSPRAALSLSAGESETLSYDLMTRRGEYDFGDPTVRVRSLSATRVVTTSVEAAGTDSLSVAAGVEAPPPERAAPARVGTLPTDSGGPGLAFHSTREYRPGDPTSRIDWRRLARTDELSTVNFREEHAARPVVVVDARPPTRVAIEAGYPTGAELAGYAGERAYQALTAAGHQAELTALGLDAADLGEAHVEGVLPWVGAGDDGTIAAARTLFEAVGRAADRGGADASADPVVLSPEGDDDLARTLAARLPPDSEVLLCSPLLDDRPVSLATAIRQRGYPVTVLSPNVVPEGSVGGRLAGVHRDDRVGALRLRGATVVDWSPDEPLDVALSASLPELIDV